MIGLGAVGGVAVLPLTRAGLNVAGIEAGTHMNPHKDFHADEVFNNVRRQVTTGPKVQHEIPSVRANPNDTARQALAHPMMNAVGGTSIHYWAQSWRLKPWDFKTRSESIQRYGAGSIPQGSTLEDWPLTYEDLEPYYDLIEHDAIGVSGVAGNIQGKLTGAGNPFEGPRQRDYPMPPLRGSGFTDHLAQVAAKMGWKPFAPPAAINSQPRKGRGNCVYHGYCSAGGCHVSAKNSTAVTTIPEALATKNLTIFDNAHVTRIEADANGRVTGVRYISNGDEVFQPAKVVMVAGYTYENSRLLLLSKSKAYPQGLSNNHGQVGRHYFGHWVSNVGALFPMDINVWYGLPAQGTACDEWADDNFDHAGLGFIGGASLHVYTERHPIEAASMSTYGRAPAWGSAWKKFIHENAGRAANTYLQTNTFPYETMYLDLDDAIRDPLGDPVCRINTGGTRENERRALGHAQTKIEQWLREAGAIEISKPEPGPPGVTTHAYGGTRMGANQDTNVVDPWGFSHEAPNLGVLGASVMGSSGARNPTLTAQALAWRSAEHLIKNWKTISE